MSSPHLNTAAFSYSKGIRSLSNIQSLLGVDRVLHPSNVAKEEYEAACALVWGRKQSGRKTDNWASKHAIPLWFLEDGFIRSSAENPHSRVTYSLVVDDVGVHYDATHPSLLENFLNNSSAVFNQQTDSELLTYLARCRQKILDNNISKYNFCRDIAADCEHFLTDQPTTLVVDQTYDDASVRYGCMKAEDFEEMLDAAIDENPHSRILVKTHPDVISGRKKGYLTQLAAKRSIAILSDNVNPFSVLKQCESVYCGTSQLGFEALLCGKQVNVFGLPFYAGWGATRDHKNIPRRTATRSVDELFYAAYDWYSRYCNPVTGERWTLEECLDHVALQKKYFNMNAHAFVGQEITPWKRQYMRQYLRSPAGSLKFGKNAGSASSRMLTWGYRAADKQKDVGDISHQIVRIEDGFLRGPGLGSDFTAPQSLVFDTQGIYFNSNKNSDLEDILNTRECTLEEIRRATRLIALIISRRLSKYAVGTKKREPIFAAAHESASKVLVIGQVENDASLRYGCRDISDNGALLAAARAACPGAYIVYKPHPDVLAGNRKGRVSREILESCADSICTAANVIDCIDACDEVHTMTSLSGFEALIRGKKVVTYGMPFYAGWGLTTDRHRENRRTRYRTLEEMVFCVLVEYPRYLDIATGEFITPEDLVVSVSDKGSMKNKNVNWARRQVLKIKNVYKGLAYAP